MNTRRAEFGRWKCSVCGFIAGTRRELAEHRKATRHRKSGKGAKLSAEHRAKISRALMGNPALGHASTPEGELRRREKIRATAKKFGRMGGKRSHSGRGKQGRYKGIWCDSSWELAWVVYNLDHGIQFERYHGFFEYVFKGEKHKYYPDFQLPDGTIVEIKGAETLPQWKAKLKYLPATVKLSVINKDSIKPYLEYMIQTYGQDFIRLYETQ